MGLRRSFFRKLYNFIFIFKIKILIIIILFKNSIFDNKVFKVFFKVKIIYIY